MAKMAASDFRRRVTAILKHFAIPQSAIDQVISAYQERWRHYHAMGHIVASLQKCHTLPLGAEQKLQLSLLIVYHDVWLKIGRKSGESERMSALWAIRDLEQCTRDRHYLIPLAQQGIEATSTHTLDLVDERFRGLVAYLLDIDLMGLGDSPSNFNRDTEAIWREYEPGFTREEFDQGRSAWAATFLERKHIFLTSQFRTLEFQARRNLEKLVNRAVA